MVGSLAEFARAGTTGAASGRSGRWPSQTVGSLALVCLGSFWAVVVRPATAWPPARAAGKHLASLRAANARLAVFGD
jgi:hypothetical protein